MDRDELLRQLARTRAGLIRTYVLHVVWFAVMCTATAMQWRQDGLTASVLLTLVTVPPVLFYTVRAHRLCRALDPPARTVGLVPVLIITVILSPFESGLVLPLKNLLATNRVLRTARAANHARIQDSETVFAARRPGRRRPGKRSAPGEWNASARRFTRTNARPAACHSCCPASPAPATAAGRPRRRPARTPRASVRPGSAAGDARCARSRAA